MFGWLPIPDWHDVIDILTVAAFGWFAIRFLRGSRVRSEIAGLGLLVGVYLLARSLDLELTTLLLQGFFAVFILVLVVVFQDDLRRIFGQLGSWQRARGATRPETGPLDVLVRTVARLAETRTGALVVLPGREPIERHVEGGVYLGGRVSEPLLLSIFDASSPGHDGAVVLRGREVERFAVHLPLSANHAELGPGGTRHAAALGLAERCDAVCVVVSEERGTVSIARDGHLTLLSTPRELAAELGRTSEPTPQTRSGWWRRGGLEAAAALAGSLVLWTIFVPGSDSGEVELRVPIEVTSLPPGYALESVEPEEATVTLRGLRRDLLLMGREDVGVQIDAYLARLGRRTFKLSADDVRKPAPLSVEAIEPERVRISVVEAPATDEAP
jgi:uncharacterized protein (TIGR00159 family)